MPKDIQLARRIGGERAEFISLEKIYAFTNNQTYYIIYSYLGPT